MNSIDLFRLLAGMSLLLLSAHLIGSLFSRFHQPAVIGEILGGLLLGPTVLGKVSQSVQQWLFLKEGPVAAGHALVYQLGMLLLMFLAGTQMRAVAVRGRLRTVGVVGVVGMMIPFALGFAFAATIDTQLLLGPAGSEISLLLVVAVGVAITSIPVISRIMLDLGMLGTRFAQTVLSIAVLEDIVLNVVLAMALGLVSAPEAEGFGLVMVLGVESFGWLVAYYAVVPIVFILVAGLITRWIRPRRRIALIDGQDSIRLVTRGVVLVMGMSALCVFLGVVPILGAFVVGLLTIRTPSGDETSAVQVIRRFSLAFPIPLYFALVGLRLDLTNDLMVGFTLYFIAFACLAKAGSVYLGARISGSTPMGSLNLAVALNARGGPGIVVATVAFDAGIVNSAFFATLVLTAMITSLLAGSWLDLAVSKGFLPSDRTELASSPNPTE